MVKSAVVTKFLKDNKYVVHPNLRVRGGGSVAKAPYLIAYNLSAEELMEKILYALDFSNEGSAPEGDRKSIQKEFLKSMEVKSMKELYDNSLCLSMYVRDGIITFFPWLNQGPKEGFSGYKEDMDVKVPFNSPKQELVKALELALSRCK